MNLYKLSNVHAYIANLFTISFTDIQGNTTGLQEPLGTTYFSTNHFFNPELNFQQRFCQV
jgi:hypothetical protein